MTTYRNHMGNFEKIMSIYLRDIPTPCLGKDRGYFVSLREVSDGSHLDAGAEVFLRPTATSYRPAPSRRLQQARKPRAIATASHLAPR
jgi:hypothetical protein